MNKNKRKNLITRQEQLEQKAENHGYIRLLQKLVTYTKLANYGDIRSRLMAVLDSDEKKRVFEATNGDNSIRDIASDTNVNIASISEWWNEWQREGIVEESKEVRGRRRKIVSLSEFGVEIPGGKRHRGKRQKLNKGNERQDRNE